MSRSIVPRRVVPRRSLVVRRRVRRRAADGGAAARAGRRRVAGRVHVHAGLHRAHPADRDGVLARRQGLRRARRAASSRSTRTRRRTTASMFKDLSTRVFNFYDRGLLGLTVDPRLGNGTGHDFVYVLTRRTRLRVRTRRAGTTTARRRPGRHTDGCVVSGTLSRIPVNANGTAGAEQILIDNEWCQQFTSHSVGHLAFGPDGYLYVTGGEGASYDNADWGQFGGSLSGTPTPKNPCGDPPGGVGVAQHVADRTRWRDALAEPAPAGRRAAGAQRRAAAHQPRHRRRRARQPDVQRVDAVGERVAHPRLRVAQPVPVHRRARARHEIWVGDVGWGIWEEINRIPTPTPTQGAELRLAVPREADPPLRLPRPRHVQGALQRHGRPADRPVLRVRARRCRSTANDTCGVQRRLVDLRHRVLHRHPVPGAVPERAVLRRPRAELHLRR